MFIKKCHDYFVYTVIVLPGNEKIKYRRFGVKRCSFFPDDRILRLVNQSHKTTDIGQLVVDRGSCHFALRRNQTLCIYVCPNVL